MAKPLFAYKHGDLQSGNWTWAVGANANIGDRPLCVATINFHGANAAGYDCEELANMFAKAVPAMTQALDPLVELCPFCNRDPYHYVDIGVGMERAAVNCCDFGVALFKDGDPLAQRVAATITRLTAERDIAEQDKFERGNRIDALTAERDALRGAITDAIAEMRHNVGGGMAWMTHDEVEQIAQRLERATLKENAR
jgi:hypothetical protein